MFKVLNLFVALLLARASYGQVVNITLTGGIVSSQFTCVAPCNENWSFVLSRTNTVTQVNVPNDVVLQELLGPAPIATRSFETFTAYDEESRSFIVIASDYPKTAGATIWLSTLNKDITVATPVIKELQIDYPTSSAPFPLNVVHLKVSRVLYGKGGVIYVTFTNGEIHSLDITNKVFKRLLSVISDSAILSNSYPAASWSQVYDPTQNVIWSVVTQGVNAFLVKSDMATLTASEWLPLIQVQGMDSGFAVETFLNMHMIQLEDDVPAKLVLTMESLPDLGFDEIVWVDTTTGQLENIVANLMEYNVLLECSNPMECDMLRVSAFDPVTKKFYFQGHLLDAEGMETLSLFYVYFFKSKITGTWEATVDPAAMVDYGYSGYQYVQIIA